MLLRNGQVKTFGGTIYFAADGTYLDSQSFLNLPSGQKHGVFNSKLAYAEVTVLCSV